MARKNKTQRQAELAAKLAAAEAIAATLPTLAEVEAVEEASLAAVALAEAVVEIEAAHDAVEAETETEEETPRGSAVPLRWRQEYARRPLKGTCSDDLAYRLDRATKGNDGKTSVAKLEAIGWANGIDVFARWGQRNPGMQRMNLGNVLRGKAKRGETVVLGDEAPAEIAA